MHKNTELRVWKFINKFGNSDDYIYNYSGDINYYTNRIIDSLKNKN